MFQAHNIETTNSTLKVVVSFKIIITTFITRPVIHNTTPDLQDQDQRPRPIILVSDRSCPKTDGLRPHHCQITPN